MVKRIFYEFLRHWSNKSRLTYAKMIGVHIGSDIRIISTNFGTEPYLIYIGNHVTISAGVKFLTHDGGLWVFRSEIPKADYINPIIIYDNVFIGIDAILLPGITIGPNAVVGAGSVVTRSVASGVVVAGVPAKVVSTLERYKRHIHSDLMTHGLPYEEKKTYLLNHFGHTKDEWLKKSSDTENS